MRDPRHDAKTSEELAKAHTIHRVRESTQNPTSQSRKLESPRAASSPGASQPTMKSGLCFLTCRLRTFGWGITCLRSTDAFAASSPLHPLISNGDGGALKAKFWQSTFHVRNTAQRLAERQLSRSPSRLQRVGEVLRDVLATIQLFVPLERSRPIMVSQASSATTTRFVQHLLSWQIPTMSDNWPLVLAVAASVLPNCIRASRR